jgi:hypothetical protein
MVRPRRIWPLVFVLSACGGKIAPEFLGGSSPAPPPPSDGVQLFDASAAPPPEPAPSSPAPPPGIHVSKQCYSGAGTSGVACAYAPLATETAACGAELDCEGHRFLAECTGDLCRCENEGFSICYCRETSGASVCGVDSCCWR